MKETIDTIIQWHKETFPDATLDGQIRKFEEETDEFKTATAENKLEELADMVIVSAGIQRFNTPLGVQTRQLCYLWTADYRYDMCELWIAIEIKMEKNRKRVWKKTAEGTFHHENGIED